MVEIADCPTEATATRANRLRVTVSSAWLPLVLLVFFALAARVTVAVTVPPWQGPDEPKHFEYVRLLVDKQALLWKERRLFDPNDASPEFQTEVIASMVKHRFWEYWGGTTPANLPKSFYEIWQGAGTQLHRPSLYYFVGAASLLPLQGAAIELQLLVVRFVSAILSTVTVAVAYLVGRVLAPEDRFVPMVSAGFVAALPMHVFVGGTVNNDNMVTLWGSLAALALAIGFRRGFTTGRLAFLFGALALAIATKRTVAGMLPVAFLAVPSWLSFLRRHLLLWVGAGLLLTAGLVAVAIGTDWLAGITYFEGLREMALYYALNEPDQFERLLKVPLASEEARQLIAQHLQWLFRSFWGIFGWFVVPLSPELYRAIAVASLVCGIGFFAWLAFQIGCQIRRPTEARGGQLLVFGVFVLLIVSMVVLAEGQILTYYSPNHMPQGRYLFPAVAPIAATYAVGARALLPRRLLGTRAPSALCILALIVLDLIAFTGTILPYYA